MRAQKARLKIFGYFARQQHRLSSFSNPRREGGQLPQVAPRSVCRLCLYCQHVYVWCWFLLYYQINGTWYSWLHDVVLFLQEDSVSYGELYCETLRSRRIFFNSYVNTAILTYKRAPFCFPDVSGRCLYSALSHTQGMLNIYTIFPLSIFASSNKAVHVL